VARLDEGSGFGRAYFGGQIWQVLFEAGTLGRGTLWYLWKLLRTYWPWLPPALVGIGMLIRRWRTDLGARLWLVYGAIVLVVISAAAGKKSRYLFQLYPALAAAAALALARVARRRPWVPLALLGAATVVTVVVVLIGERLRLQRAQRRGPRGRRGAAFRCASMAHTRGAVRRAAARQDHRVLRSAAFAHLPLDVRGGGRGGASVVTRDDEAERARR
jgi:hypothetical protein